MTPEASSQPRGRGVPWGSVHTMIRVVTRHPGFFFCSLWLAGHGPRLGCSWNCPEPLPPGFLATCARFSASLEVAPRFFEKVSSHKGQRGRRQAETALAGPQLRAECSFWAGGFLVPDALDEPVLVSLLRRLFLSVLFSVKWA